MTVAIAAPPKPKQEVAEMQRLIGLYAVNNTKPELKYEILAYLEYWEKFDKNPFYLQKAKELLNGTDYSNLWLKYYYLTEDYAKATSFDFTNQELSAWEYFMLGVSFAKQKQMSQSFFYIEKSYAKDPTHKVVGEQLLKYYISNGKLEKASKVGEALLQEFPSSANVLNSLAQVSIMKGNSADGEKLMQQALNLSPDDTNVWITHFNFYLRSKDRLKTKYWGERILVVKPDFIESSQLDEILNNMK